MRRPGYRAFLAALVFAACGEAPEVESSDGRSCVLVVADAEGPVAHADVRLDALPRRLVTGLDGSATFAWPDARVVTFRVHHPDHGEIERTRTYRPEIVIRLDSESSRRFRPPPDRPRIRGRVTFPDGSPVPNHPVRASTSRTPRGLRARTNRDGTYEIRVLEETQHEVHCRAASPERRRCVAPVRDLDFVVVKSLLETDVVDPAGAPVEDPMVSVRARNAYVTLDRHAVDPGSDVVVRINAPGFRAAERTIEAWSENASLHRARIELVPACAAAVLLRVTRADGTEPERVCVMWKEPTSSGYNFRLLETTPGEPLHVRDLDRGPGKLCIYGFGKETLRRFFEVDAALDPTAVHEVRLPEGGHAMLIWPGAPEKCLVALVPRSGDPAFPTLPDDGRFRPTGPVPAGEYDWQARRGKEVLRESPVTVAAGESVETDWSE